MVLINLNFNVDYLPEVSEFVIINKITLFVLPLLCPPNSWHTVYDVLLLFEQQNVGELLSLLKSWSWNFDALDGYRLFSQDRCRVQNWNVFHAHVSQEFTTKTHCFVSSSENYPFKNSLFWNWLDWLKLLEIVSLTKFQNPFLRYPNYAWLYA